MKTLLFETHRRAGARMVSFNGWDMPLFYSGIIDEHGAVRSRAGMFDLCHMARIEIRGREGERKLNENITADLSVVRPGRAVYSLICGESGGIIDDVLVYRLKDSFLVVANAGNRQAVLGVLAGPGAADVTGDMGMIAVQGPTSADIAETVFGAEVKALKNYDFGEFVFDKQKVLVSRTGYTGEDGFEIFFDSGLCSGLWDRLLQEGPRAGLKPAGLGARDLLRLEAGLPLYGHELDMDVNPFEAGLGRFVSPEKRFTGSAALKKFRTEKPVRRLKGFTTAEKVVPRQGCPVFSSGGNAGEVTSGSYSPSLGKSIGMGYIKTAYLKPGALFELRIRNKNFGVDLIDLPFYKKEGKNVSE